MKYTVLLSGALAKGTLLLCISRLDVIRSKKKEKGTRFFQLKHTKLNGRVLKDYQTLKAYTRILRVVSGHSLLVNIFFSRTIYLQTPLFNIIENSSFVQ